MPVVSFAKGVLSSPTGFLESLNQLGSTATLDHVTASRAVFTDGTERLAVTGSGLTFAVDGGETRLTGGTITGITVLDGGAKELTVSTLTLAATDLQAARDAEHSAINTGAAEALFLPMGWTYRGHANGDFRGATSASSDGVLFNLSGNDTILSGAGDDAFFAGSGNDRMVGGAGYDFLQGGMGRDTLLGGGQGDALNGDDGADLLKGGGDTDRLDGGLGNDTLIGGVGNDTLIGGAGADRFVFQHGAGIDEIRDLDIAHDVIDLPGHAHSFRFNGTTTVLDYGSDQIYLDGIALADATLIHII